MSGCHPTIECKCVCHLPSNTFHNYIMQFKDCCKCNTSINLEERIAKLESENQITQENISCLDQAHSDALLDLENRIRKLEGHYYSDGDLSAIHGQIDNLNKHNDLIEKDVNRLDIHIKDILIWKMSIKNNKKPHKCPVCDGFGKQLYLIAQQVQICNSCEGKGFVFG